MRYKQAIKIPIEDRITVGLEVDTIHGPMNWKEFRSYLLEA